MDTKTNRKEIPADLSRAGEARHFISWRGAIAGLGGGRLSDLAVAAEAALTDIFLSAEGGRLEIVSEHTEKTFRITITHHRLEERRMAGLSDILKRFLDDHDLSPTRTVLVKYPVSPPSHEL